MVTLSTLHAHNQPAFLIHAEAATADTHVLFQHEVVLHGHDHGGALGVFVVSRRPARLCHRVGTTDSAQLDLDLGRSFALGRRVQRH